MKQENIVAIWLGKFKDENSLKNYTEKKFPKAIGFSTLDEDFHESSFYPAPIDYKNIIQEHSFNGYYQLEFFSFVSKLKNRNEFNAVLMVFGQKSQFGDVHLELFNYKDALKKSAPIQFIGSARFSTI